MWVATDCDLEMDHFIKVIMTWTVWCLTVIAWVCIKVCMVWADSCDQVAWQYICSCQQAAIDPKLEQVIKDC